MYALRRGVSLLVLDANTRKDGTISVKFRGSVLWKNLLANLKECQSLLEFKQLIKQSGSLPCTCSACTFKENHLPRSSYFKIYVLNYMM